MKANPSFLFIACSGLPPSLQFPMSHRALDCNPLRLRWPGRSKPNGNGYSCDEDFKQKGKGQVLHDSTGTGELLHALRC